MEPRVLLSEASTRLPVMLDLAVGDLIWRGLPGASYLLLSCARTRCTARGVWLLLLRLRHRRLPILNKVTHILNGSDSEFLPEGNRVQEAPDRA
jgi:hypothetical protein